MGLFKNNAEPSIFNDKIEAESKNKLGEKTRISDADQAQDYYNNAAKLAEREKGDELADYDYKLLDSALKTILDNKKIQKLEIQWDLLTKDELEAIYRQSHNLELAKFKPSVFEKFMGILGTTSACAMIILITGAFKPEIAINIDNKLGLNGEFIKACQEIKKDPKNLAKYSVGFGVQPDLSKLEK